MIIFNNIDDLWCNGNKMIVRLIARTHEAVRVTGAAARSCYSSETAGELYDENDSELNLKVLNMTMKSGHHSVLEHAVFTFSIEGVSRALTHQLVRHRIASYSQQSQRYVNYSGILKEIDSDEGHKNDTIEKYFVIPPSVKKKKDDYERFIQHCERSLREYVNLVKNKIKKEDARFLLPNAMTTNIVVTMNVRELIHFFNLRTCNRAQWEIRSVARKMLELCKKEEPNLFKNVGPDCIMYNICNEGKLTCGDPPWELKDDGNRKLKIRDSKNSVGSNV